METLKAHWGKLLAAALLLYFLWAVATVDSAPEPVCTSANAEYFTERLVKERLKAPSTADLNTTRVWQEGNVFHATGTVDAENSFGAKLRSEYHVQVECVNAEKLVARSVVIR